VGHARPVQVHQGGGERGQDGHCLGRREVATGGDDASEAATGRPLEHQRDRPARQTDVFDETDNVRMAHPRAGPPARPGGPVEFPCGAMTLIATDKPSLARHPDQTRLAAPIPRAGPSRYPGTWRGPYRTRGTGSEITVVEGHAQSQPQERRGASGAVHRVRVDGCLQTLPPSWPPPADTASAPAAGCASTRWCTTPWSSPA